MPNITAGLGHATMNPAQNGDASGDYASAGMTPDMLQGTIRRLGEQHDELGTCAGLLSGLIGGPLARELDRLVDQVTDGVRALPSIVADERDHAARSRVKVAEVANRFAADYATLSDVHRALVDDLLRLYTTTAARSAISDTLPPELIDSITRLRLERATMTGTDKRKARRR